MDAFHIACHSHKARLKNILKTPGLDPHRKSPFQTAVCKPFCRAGRVCGEAEEGIGKVKVCSGSYSYEIAYMIER